MAEGYGVRDVAQTYGLGEQTVRDYLHAFVRRGLESLVYKQPPGIKAKLTATQKQKLKQWSSEGPLKLEFRLTTPSEQRSLLALVLLGLRVFGL